MKVTFSDTSARYRECYAELVDRTRDTASDNRYDRLFPYLAVTATIAWSNAFQWYDDDLKSILESIGDALVSALQPIESKQAESEDIRIAYIRTSLAYHSGHSGTLRLRTRFPNDDDDLGQQYLALPNIQNCFSCPNLKAMSKRFGISIEQLGPDSTYASRVDGLAEWMRDMSSDLVVLFINPNDAIAFTALAGLSFPAQVIFYNHDDQVFWLGLLLIDDVVEYQTGHHELSRVHRTGEAEALVPLPSAIAPVNIDDLHASFESGIVSVSVDNSNKIQPQQGYEYLETIEQILKKYSGHQHVLIKDSPESIGVYPVLLTGIRSWSIVGRPHHDVCPLYRIANAVLDMFRFRGGTVWLVTGGSDFPFVGFNVKEFPFIPDADDLRSSYVYVAGNEEEYVDMTVDLNQSQEKRVDAGKKCWEAFRKRHAPDIIGSRLNVMVIGHRPEEGPDIYAPLLDMEAYATFTRKPRITNHTLLSHTLQRQSLFGLAQRIEFNLMALRSGEINSPLQLPTYLILAHVGYPIYIPT